MRWRPLPSTRELARVGAQAAVEVEDVTVRVALAQDRHEAEDVALKAEAFAVGLDQPFARELGGAVERGLNRERRVFRRREDIRLAVDRAGGGEGDPANAVGSHRLEHIERRDGVLLEISSRMLGPEADIGVRREVEDEIAAAHRGGQALEIEGVAFNQREIGPIAARRPGSARWPDEKLS